MNQISERHREKKQKLGGFFFQFFFRTSTILQFQVKYDFISKMKLTSNEVGFSCLVGPQKNAIKIIAT